MGSLKIYQIFVINHFLLVKTDPALHVHAAIAFKKRLEDFGDVSLTKAVFGNYFVDTYFFLRVFEKEFVEM